MTRTPRAPQRTGPRQPLEHEALIAQVLDAWRRNNDVLLYLLDHIPEEGFAALPAGSRGRDVAAVFSHLHRVRAGWVHFHETGKRPGSPRYDKSKPPAKAQLRKSLQESGAAVERFVEKALREGARPRMFGGSIVRWMAYLLTHDAHHRGQIMLALKQSGMRLPNKIAIEGLWGKWFYG